MLIAADGRFTTLRRLTPSDNGRFSRARATSKSSAVWLRSKVLEHTSRTMSMRAAKYAFGMPLILSTSRLCA